jgi:chromosome segregation protein
LTREIAASRKALAEAEASRPVLADRSEDANAPAARPNSRWPRQPPIRQASKQSGASPKRRWIRRARGWTGWPRVRADRATAQRNCFEQAAEAEVAAATDAVAKAGRDLAPFAPGLKPIRPARLPYRSHATKPPQLATAKAELAGVEREHTALARDREARAKREASRQGLPTALDKVTVAPGYERALAAALGRDGKAPLGVPRIGAGRSFLDRRQRRKTGSRQPAGAPVRLPA